MPETEDKRSRRAKRREAQQASSAGASDERGAREERDARESEDAGAAEQAEPADGEGADADAGEAEAAADLAAAAKTKRAKKRQASSTEAIRDRNRRIREQAAARRRAERERERGSTAVGLDASEMVDDALARSTHALSSFVRQHFNVVQWTVVLLIAGGFGWQIYTYVHNRSIEKASDALASAIAAETGRVGAATANDEEEGWPDRQKTFPDEAARLQAAEQDYSKAMAMRPGSGTAILAELGLAGILYDQGKYDEARAHYEAVKASALAAHDNDVNARAIEGIGLILESKKDLDGALRAFSQLENLGVPAISALGLYHQARIALAKGERDKAKELLKKLQERLEAARTGGEESTYLELAGAELMRAVDPNATLPLSPNASLEQLEQLRKQLKADPTKLQNVGDIEALLKQLGKVGKPAGSAGRPPTAPEPGKGNAPAPPSPPGNAPENTGE